MATIRYPLHPDSLEQEPPFIRDMRGLANQRKLLGMRAIGKMLKDLLENGTESRYLIGITGYPILELKTTSRGGQPGGARVYLYRADDQEFHLCAAEVKSESAANTDLIKRTAYIAWHWLHGYEIFPKTRANKRTGRTQPS